jgi:hypothetical protein
MADQPAVGLALLDRISMCAISSSLFSLQV